MLNFTNADYTVHATVYSDASLNNLGLIVDGTIVNVTTGRKACSLGTEQQQWVLNSVGCGRQAGVAQHCRAPWRESRLLRVPSQLFDRHCSAAGLCLCCDCVMIVMEPGDLLTGKSKLI